MPARDTAMCGFGLVSCCVQWWFGNGVAVWVSRRRKGDRSRHAWRGALASGGAGWRAGCGQSHPLANSCYGRLPISVVAVVELLMHDANVKRSGLGVLGRGLHAGREG